jgi:hypothetical protein
MATRRKGLKTSHNKTRTIIKALLRKTTYKNKKNKHHKTKKRYQSGGGPKAPKAQVKGEAKGRYGVPTEMKFLRLLLKEGKISQETFDKLVEQQKKDHLKWCWERTINSFHKENIQFLFNEKDSIFFKDLFYDVFYNQNDKKGQENVFDFFVQIFGYESKKSKSDIEIFTDIYKTLERSLKNA